MTQPHMATGNSVNAVLTPTSPPGIYVVVTASRTIYRVEVGGAGGDRVTRIPSRDRLLLDGEPLTGVQDFYFDERTGAGRVLWQKQDPPTHDSTEASYGGTWRTTSAVLVVGRLMDHTENEELVTQVITAVFLTLLSAAPPGRQ